MEGVTKHAPFPGGVFMFRFVLPALAAVVLTSSLAHAEILFGVTSADNLVTFSSSNPASFLSQVAITGLQPGERLVGIDFRPATSQLFGVGSSSRLYTIDAWTGAASQVGGLFSIPLNGTFFGVNFNPVADRIRVVSDQDQNLRLNPNDGAVIGTGDTSLTYANGSLGSPTIFGTSYENSIAGASTTRQFFIDPVLDLLGVINFPNANFNAGVINAVGGLGINVPGGIPLGFDISAVTGSAYLASGGNLWTVNTSSGLATFLGSVGIGSGQDITAISAAPVPEPGTLAQMGLGLALVLFRFGLRKR
jgi:hypothetical protein